jgi:hypothetical protein
MCPVAANLFAPERADFFANALRALFLVPPCAPVGLVNNGMNKPVSVIPCMREWAFLLLCDYFFLPGKPFWQDGNFTAVNYGSFKGGALPPLF